jgi:hypothetical protein
MATDIPSDIDTLAQALGDRKGVWWSIASNKLAGGNSDPKDATATQAAEAWVKNPNPGTQSAAASAAKATDFQGSGSWSAQAAAYANPSGAGATSGANSPTRALVPKMVAGSVKISAANSVGVTPPSGAGASSAGLPQSNLGSALSSGTAKIPGVSAPTIASSQISSPKISVPQVPGSKPDTPPVPSADDLAKTDEAHRPFIELGQQILAGKKLWT